MRKTILPSKGYFILSLLGSFCALAVIAAWPGFMSASIECLLYTFKVDNLFERFLFFFAGLTGVVAYTPICFMASFSVVYLFLVSGRPMKFSEDEISFGYIKKTVYRKEDITGIGIAPLVSENPIEQARCKTQGIYIAFGDYKKEDMRKYGVLNVFEQVEIRKILPKSIKFINRMTSNKTFQKHAPGISDASGVHVFDGMLWTTYTEEKFRFLKTWLGSKYYELLQ